MHHLDPCSRTTGQWRQIGIKVSPQHAKDIEIIFERISVPGRRFLKVTSRDIRGISWNKLSAAFEASDKVLGKGVYPMGGMI